MRTIKYTLVAAFLTLVFTSYAASMGVSANSGVGQQQYMDDEGVSYQTFYDELSPYGDWVYDNQYGYVWRPDMGPDFMPYRTGGHWVSSEIGWTWVSDYSWGWAPFHYGRWKFDNYMGWYWIPGYEWAPAWVIWSSSNDYYGWAPMAPGWNINVSINIGSVPSNYWVFAPPRYISSPRLYSYCAPVYNNVTIVRNVTIVNNYNVYNRTRYVCGPRVHEYNRLPGCSARPVPIRECHDARGSRYDNRELYVYRPRVSQRSSARPETIRSRDYYVNRNESRPRDRDNNGQWGNSNRNRPSYGNSSNESRPGNNNSGRPSYENPGNGNRPDNNSGRPSYGNQGNESRRPNNPGNTDRIENNNRPSYGNESRPNNNGGRPSNGNPGNDNRPTYPNQGNGQRDYNRSNEQQNRPERPRSENRYQQEQRREQPQERRSNENQRMERPNRDSRQDNSSQRVQRVSNDDSNRGSEGRSRSRN
ncbi:hypothetical protein D3C80_370280 [compost metagenome]